MDTSTNLSSKKTKLNVSANKISILQNQTSGTKTSGSMSKGISGTNYFSGMIGSSNMTTDIGSGDMTSSSYKANPNDVDIPHLGDLVEYLCT